MFLSTQHSGWHDHEKVAISSEIFAEEIAPPLSGRDAARQLALHGILMAGGEARSLQQRRSPKIDPDRGREYWLCKSMLGITLPAK